MNASMVIRVTSAVGQYVKQNVDALERGAVIGIGRHGSLPADCGSPLPKALRSIILLVCSPRLAHALHTRRRGQHYSRCQSQSASGQWLWVYWKTAPRLFRLMTKASVHFDIDNTMDVSLGDLNRGTEDVFYPFHIRFKMTGLTASRSCAYAGPTPLSSFIRRCMVRSASVEQVRPRAMRMFTVSRRRQNRTLIFQPSVS